MPGTSQEGDQALSGPTELGYCRSDRQKQEPSILQSQACITPALLFTGSLPSHAHGLEAREDMTYQMLPASHNLLLLTLKWDLPTVCFTMFGVTAHIFHRSSFLCSQGSFSTKKAKR